ncbi:MAG TPA: hypothetical protein VK726_15415, partial [Acetobacteraceae bacterium]|nr:hypothetical protein [Acetobacteraceae bacterium]
SCHPNHRPKSPPPLSLAPPDVVKTFSSNALINNEQAPSNLANPRRRANRLEVLADEFDGLFAIRTRNGRTDFVSG